VIKPNVTHPRGDDRRRAAPRTDHPGRDHPATTPSPRHPQPAPARAGAPPGQQARSPRPQ
jgi:hypothetical protein